MLHQTQELERRPHIVVATPGRLCDLLRSDAMHYGKLSRVQTLVGSNLFKRFMLI